MPGARPLAASDGGAGFAFTRGAVRRRTALEAERLVARFGRLVAFRRLLMKSGLTHGSGKAETLHGSVEPPPWRRGRDGNVIAGTETFVHPFSWDGCMIGPAFSGRQRDGTWPNGS